MELLAYGGQVMVRLENWKAIRKNLLKKPDAPVELRDLARDAGERKDVATANPAIAKCVVEVMRAEQRPSKEFPFPAPDGLS